MKSTCPPRPLVRPRLVAVALGLIAGYAAQAGAETEVTPDQVVGAFEANFGVHAGQRRNHTKGMCASGEFVGNPQVASLSRSPLFSGRPIPVVARLSLAGGAPNAPDTARSPRGLAVEFKLPGGQLQHMTMLNLPVFGVADPQAFYAQQVATRNDPATGKPDPEKVRAFRAAHPEGAAAARYLAEHNPPASYASAAYYGIHTFRFIGKDDRVTLVRWRFTPQDGEHELSNDEMRSAPADFLEPAMIERLRKGPVRWTMIVTIGEPGDTETNPTVAWPAGRREVEAGTLTLTAATPQKGAPCEPINYDPLVMADGIAPTADPVLMFRSPAYAASFARRLTGR